jgi:LPS sulfotransferase NodH
MAGFVTMCSAVNSASGWLQRRILGRKVAETELAADPVFILGHWRTGTTLLHELLSLDGRYATPTTYECFAPRHFLLTHRIYPHLLRIPSRRPMDNIAVGWKAPQEDEFALCSMGVPSPYRRIAFPNRPVRHLDYMNMETVPAHELARWKAALMEFVRNLNYANKRPLILKSPTHTGRIKVLLEMFPAARFIHLSRSPYDFVPSTIHLWRALDYSNGLQKPSPQSDAALQDYVFECFHRMYQGYHRYMHDIPAANIYEMRYDDLVRAPLSVLNEAYNHLSLGDFATVRPKIEAAVDQNRNYRRNVHTISSDLRDAIDEKCAFYMERFGHVDTAAEKEVAA